MTKLIYLVGLNVLGIVENMGETCIPLSGLESHDRNGIRLVDAKGLDVTDSILLR